MNYRTQKKDDANKKLWRAIMLIVLTAAVLTVGEFWGDGQLPSWSSVIAEYLETVQPSGPDLSGTDIAVHVIDVGQGDCTLVQSENVNILIDAGVSSGGSDAALYIRKLGVSRLDWFVATHPHIDHIGGMDEVLDVIGVDNIMMTYTPPQREPEESFYKSALDAVEESGANVVYANAGDVYEIGSLKMEVLHPVYGTDFEDMNDSSVSLRISSGGVSLLTCGDITYEVEDSLLQSGVNLDSTIYIANHHGSALSNDKEFIAAASPDYAAFSCGKDNGYGHPHKSVLDTMKEMNIPYYRTDMQGTIVFICTENGIEIKTEKEGE